MTGWPIEDRPGWSWRGINDRTAALTGPDGGEVLLRTNAVGFTVQVVDGPGRWVEGPFESALFTAVDFAEGAAHV